MQSHALGWSALISLLCASAALAQPCASPFAPGYDYGTLTANTSSISTAAIECSIIFDDHSGAGPALFIAGSGFAVAGSGQVHLAKFVNGRWHGIPGFNNAIHAMTIQGQGAAATLVVAGDFTSIPGSQPANRVASFNGTTWSPLGALGGSVRSLLAIDEPTGPAIYAGGSMSSAPFLSKWTGATWTNIALPPSNPSTGDSNAGIRAIARFDDGSGPKLYVGASRFWNSNTFGVAAYDGSTWTPIPGLTGQGSWPELTSLAVVNEPSGPQLYAGGMLTNATENGGQPLARLVNGAWQLIATDLSGPAGRGAAALAAINTPEGQRLIAAVGNDAHLANRVRSYLDGVWSDLPGTFARTGGGLMSIRSLAIHPDNGQLVAFGNFNRVDSIVLPPPPPSTAAPGAAAWNGAAWTAVETIGLGLTTVSPVFVDPVTPSFAYIGSSRFATGAALPLDLPFTPTSMVRLTHPTSTLVIARNDDVRVNDGSGWVALPDASSALIQVFVATDTGAETLVGSSGSRLFRYINGAWDPLAPALTSAGFSDVATYDDGQGAKLYVGGAITSATTQPLFAIVADGQLQQISVPAPVRSMQVFNIGAGPELLLACGGSTGSGLYAWNGASLRDASIGLPANTPINTLRILDTGAGARLWCAAQNALYFWNGAQWEHSGLSTDGPIYSIGVITRPDSLKSMFLTGIFTTAGSLVASNIAEARFCGPNCTADFNADGDSGADADIEAFFACLAGNCCPTCGTSDFNQDGDLGTDADIESFFRVLAGGAC